MEIIQCDICKNQSPSKDRLYIANDWCEVKLVSPWRSRNRFAEPKIYIFCNECMPYEKGGDPNATTLLAAIKGFLGFDTKNGDKD